MVLPKGSHCLFNCVDVLPCLAFSPWRKMNTLQVSMTLHRACYCFNGLYCFKNLTYTEKRLTCIIIVQKIQIKYLLHHVAALYCTKTPKHALKTTNYQLKPLDFTRRYDLSLPTRIVKMFN